MRTTDLDAKIQSLLERRLRGDVAGSACPARQEGGCAWGRSRHGTIQCVPDTIVQ
jgi:hypothetical protein